MTNDQFKILHDYFGCELKQEPEYTITVGYNQLTHPGETRLYYKGIFIGTPSITYESAFDSIKMINNYERNK